MYENDIQMQQPFWDRRGNVLFVTETGIASFTANQKKPYHELYIW